VEKVFDLVSRLRAVRTDRPNPVIPTAPITLSLFLGAVLRVPSLLQLQRETNRRGWQRLVSWSEPISDDAFCYALERYDPEDLRQVLAGMVRQLKLNKQLERCKIAGLLVVALDANEQFNSRSRCCEQCCQRTVTVKDRDGQKQQVTEYFHRQVYAQLHGPDFSVILDVEPIRPDEDESHAALRLLGRLRRLYGPRFFDVVTVDAWYPKGPWLRAVQKLGWAVVCVLKQEEYEIYQEAEALRKTQDPVKWEVAGRLVQAWEVRDLDFTVESLGKVRVVVAQEQWQEVHRRAGKKLVQAQESHWRWLVLRELDGYGVQTICRIGHQRWGIENHAFNELTQHYHLTHCEHHHPVAILAGLLILIIAFVAFELFAKVHGKLVRLGKLTLLQVTRLLDLSIERWEDLQPLWSG
jgi:hypothetical protein